MMVIKALAIELYQAQQKVHKLQEKLEKADLSGKELVRRELRTATAECEQLRRMIEARKEKPLFRTSHKNESPF